MLDMADVLLERPGVPDFERVASGNVPDIISKSYFFFFRKQGGIHILPVGNIWFLW